MGSKPGPRPHTWMVQGEIPHQQHIAWLRMRAQANFRGEDFTLTLEQFQKLWNGFWHLRGRSSPEYCLTRTDIRRPWEWGNVECVTRNQHFMRQLEVRRQRKETKNGKHSKRN